MVPLTVSYGQWVTERETHARVGSEPRRSAPLEDSELLAAWREGDRAAGDQLLDRYFAPLLRFFGSKSDDAIDDLVQETLLECVRSAERQRASSTFRSFLFGIAHNVLKRHYERSGRSRSRYGGGVTSLDHMDSVQSASTLMLRAEESRLLLRALRRMPLDEQLLLELSYWEEFTSREIGEILAIPAGTVRTRQLHARKRLRAEVEAIAASPEHSASTIEGFDTWAARVRESG